jgi:hypothetical protein
MSARMVSPHRGQGPLQHPRSRPGVGWGQRRHGRQSSQQGGRTFWRYQLWPQPRYVMRS